MTGTSPELTMSAPGLTAGAPPPPPQDYLDDLDRHIRESCAADPKFAGYLADAEDGARLGADPSHVQARILNAYSSLIDALDAALDTKTRALFAYEDAAELYELTKAHVTVNSAPATSPTTRAALRIAIDKDVECGERYAEKTVAWFDKESAERTVEVLRDRISLLRHQLAGRL